MQKDIEELSDLVLKIKRLETTLSAKVDRFVESEKAISDYKKELTIEIEELKSLGKSLPKLIGSSMKESSSVELPKILPSLVKSFKETTLDFANSSVKEADRLKNEINKAVHQAQRAISSGKKDITLRSIGMTFVFCLSSVITALSIFYFFPQHQHVHYAFNHEAATYMSYGMAYAECFKELGQKDKDMIMNKAIGRLKKVDF
jgi:hypothetical protein